MTAESELQQTVSPPPFSLGGCLEGVRLFLPVLPGIFVYGLAFGTAAAHRGMSLAETAAMSGFVYAGASQMVALEVWRNSWTPGAILAVAIITATVNARFVLMSASFQPWMSRAPGWRNALHLFFLVDANFLIGSRYHAEGGRDLGVPFGAGVASWFAWMASTVPGYLAGSLVPEPRRFALDLVMPVFFAAMAVPLWRGLRATGLPWAVAAAVALVVDWLLPGYAFIVAGALAGAITGGFLRDSR